jgi:hypothetical protein
MTIPLPPGLRVEDVVDLVFSSARQDVPYEDVLGRLVAVGLSREDAALAYDRALGGLVRAATRNPSNEPSTQKDPIAHASYVRCMREPSLIAAIRPDWAQPHTRRRWWQFWK